MQSSGILNRDIATVLARLGHTDTIVIADCGLPIPENVLCIDVSLKMGSPGLIEVLQTLLSDMEIEHVTLAEEIKLSNSRLHTQLDQVFFNIPRTYCEHETLKNQMTHAKAIIRTGEATPFGNVILHSGVIF